MIPSSLNPTSGIAHWDAKSVFICGELNFGTCPFHRADANTPIFLRLQLTNRK